MKIAFVLGGMTFLGSIFAGFIEPTTKQRVAVRAISPSSIPPSPVKQQDGIKPVPDPVNQIPSDSERLEAKVDTLLQYAEANLQETKAARSDISALGKVITDSGRENALLIVDAIKTNAICPDCPAADAGTEARMPPANSTNYPSKSSSKWRIGGREWDRSSLLSHLKSHPNHAGKYQTAALDAMTVGQLRWLHDQDHDASVGVRDIVPVPIGGGGSNPCPGGICPSNVFQRSRTFNWQRNKPLWFPRLRGY